MDAVYPPEVEEAMCGLFESLSERERRQYAAVEAAKLGRGGLTYLATVLVQWTPLSRPKNGDPSLLPGPVFLNRTAR